MTAKDPAYPVPHPSSYRGLSKRELVAAMALQGMLACHNETTDPERLAERAVDYATALLRRLGVT